jgi:hypothetical protein
MGAAQRVCRKQQIGRGLCPHGFALGVRSVGRFGRGGAICGQKCRKCAA